MPTQARFHAAAVQLTSTEDKAENLRTALAQVEKAAAAGASLIVLPELFTCLGRPAAVLAAAENVPGETSEALCRIGTPPAGHTRGWQYLRAFARSRQGIQHQPAHRARRHILAQYRKRHLFDLEIPGQVNCRESSWLMPGETICAADTRCGRIGLAICYDLRFPELFRQLAARGCQLFCVPAAFTLATGRDHWEVLLRHRAIENQAYVIASNQFGQHAPGLTTYGRSMIIDPWGTVLATAADGAGIIAAEVDLARVAAVRTQLPALAHRRD